MKGMNALEIIFTLFVLIVVVLVVVRMFITRFTFTGIEQPIQDITDTYNYEAAYSTCNSLCNKYEADCSNLQNAVRFCEQQVEIDIDGDRVPAEKYHYNVVEGVPMCEDGIYCFHVKTDCTCGAMRLDPESCLMILCDYYTQTRGYAEVVAARIIKNEISYGSCQPDVIQWKGKIKDYKIVPLPEDEYYSSDWSDEIQYMGPDYWWAKAGYNAPCGVELVSGMSLYCTQVTHTQKIRCVWGEVPVVKAKTWIFICTDEEPICGEGHVKAFKRIESSDGSYTTPTELSPGHYIVRLQSASEMAEQPVEVESVE